MSTLSVEISNSGSSRSILSPSFFSHLVSVPSTMLSPIWGITTSVIQYSPLGTNGERVPVEVQLPQIKIEIRAQSERPARSTTSLRRAARRAAPCEVTGFVSPHGTMY